MNTELPSKVEERRGEGRGERGWEEGTEWDNHGPSFTENKVVPPICQSHGPIIVDAVECLPMQPWRALC